MHRPGPTPYRQRIAGPVTRDSLHLYRAELVSRRRAGDSYPALAMWLLTAHRVRVAHTTVMRYMRALPELPATGTRSRG